MNDQKRRPRLAAGVSIPMGILLLIFFFLPWVNLRCADMTIGHATGMQLAIGKITMDMPDMGAAGAEKQQEQKDPDARPIFFLGLLLPLAICIVGVFSLKGRIGVSPTGAWLTALGVVGLIVMIMAANVDYSDEMVGDAKKSPQAQPQSEMEKQMAAQMDKQMSAQMNKQITTEATGILWMSLVLYILVASAGVMCFLRIAIPPAAASQVPTAADVPPPASEPPPAQDQPPSEPPAQ
jgi:hypothetical protein